MSWQWYWYTRNYCHAQLVYSISMHKLLLISTMQLNISILLPFTCLRKRIFRISERFIGLLSNGGDNTQLRNFDNKLGNVDKVFRKYWQFQWSSNTLLIVWRHFQGHEMAREWWCPWQKLFSTCCRRTCMLSLGSAMQCWVRLRFSTKKLAIFGPVKVKSLHQSTYETLLGWLCWQYLRMRRVLLNPSARGPPSGRI